MESRKALTASTRGDVPFDIGIVNVQLINVLTAEIYPADIGIHDGRIALVSPAGQHSINAVQTINGEGLWAAPGFIDGHVHNESTMCTPANWAEVILPMGTTTVCTDPHEIGNVLGLDGVRYMLEASQHLPIRYYLTIPSCVPAVPHLETTGAIFTEKEVTAMRQWPRTIAIAEAMDFVGLANQTGNITPIVETGHKANLPIEGHAPGVEGLLLQTYLAAAGPRSSDHESFSKDNMVEKVRSGMMVYARLSSFGDATEDTANAIRALPDRRMFGFCTDDIMPDQLIQSGHLNHGMGKLIEAGIDPITVYQMASINVAEHYGLRGLGAIAPGWLADIVLLDDLHTVKARHVITHGKLRVQDGKLLDPISEPVPPLLDNTVRLPKLLTIDSFRPSVNGQDTVTVNAINIHNHIDTYIDKITLPTEDGFIRFPLPDGVALAAVCGRHGQNQPPALAAITGYHLNKGAIATTVSHDSHNLTIIGKTPEEMYHVTQVIHSFGGGLAAVKDGQVLGTVPLPISGLMSDLKVTEITEQVNQFNAVLPLLGLPKAFPLTLLTLALPVVPRVRLTDKGIVDIMSQSFIPFA